MADDEEDEKEFECPICGGTEKTYAAMELHLRVDHGITN